MEGSSGNWGRRWPPHRHHRPPHPRRRLRRRGNRPRALRPSARTPRSRPWPYPPLRALARKHHSHRRQRRRHRQRQPRRSHAPTRLALRLAQRPRSLPEPKPLPRSPHLKPSFPPSPQPRQPNTLSTNTTRRSWPTRSAPRRPRGRRRRARQPHPDRSSAKTPLPAEPPRPEGGSSAVASLVSTRCNTRRADRGVTQQHRAEHDRAQVGLGMRRWRASLTPRSASSERALGKT
jgi:hypothetical protein